jgi:monoamine oxidase
LGLALAAAGTAGLTQSRRLVGHDPSAASSTPRPDPGARRRVVVAGAGLAGLTAALDLRHAGWDVVVVEARERVGGRVHTLRAPFSDPLHAEAGGESIDDNHDQLLALIARFGLSTERRPSDKLADAVAWYRGRRTKVADFVQARGAAVEADYSRFGDAVDKLGAGIDPEHPERAARAADLDGRNYSAFIADQHLVPEADFLVRVGERALYNAQPAEVSLLFVAQQAAALANVPTNAEETMRITGGNDQLPAAMADELGDQLRLRSPVTRVEHGRDGVRVNAGGRPIDAAWLVLALPTSPLRRVAFDPALPSSVAAVIRGLDLGAAAKVITEYQTRFWEGQQLSGFMVTDLPFGVGWAPTDSYPSTPGLLTQFITARAARAAAKRGDADRIRWAQRQLGTVWPDAHAQQTAQAATVAWANEAYTGGGYAVFRPGQLAPSWPVLRNGYRRIRFAGEHTESLAGYMESAVRSGHRIAAELGPPPTE